MSIIRDLGFFEDTVNWQDLGTCRNNEDIDPDNYFDNYEADEVIARETDTMCLSCPVAEHCFNAGRSTKSWGVWGGVYLENGKPSKKHNSHKTEQVWKDVRRAVGEHVKI